MTTLFAIFGFFALIGISALWRAYVLTVMWAWFVVPTFHVSGLSMPMAYGLSLLVAMLTSNKTGNEAESTNSATEKFANAMALSFILPAIVLLFGWITTKFI